MSDRYWRLALTLVVASGGATHCFGQQTCGLLSSATLEKLSIYVGHNYRLPFRLTAEPADVSFVEDTCYRRIRFSSVDGQAPSFGVTLFLSPDTRFLSKELFDSTRDPVAEQKQRDKRLLNSLVRNTAPALGPPDAPVTITVFSDFQCPYCKQQARILRDEVAPFQPNVRILFRHLPLPIHDWSRTAAELAACAASQSDEAFWAVHDFFFNHQTDLRLSEIVAGTETFADSLRSLDAARFRNCVQSSESSKSVDLDLALAREIEVTSTPTLFVNSMRINGVASAEQLRTLVQELASTQAREAAATTLSDPGRAADVRTRGRLAPVIPSETVAGTHR